jgi:Serine carboxypeptidase S28
MLRMAGWRLWKAVAFSAALFSVHAIPASDLLRVMGPQGINLWKLQQSSQAHDRMVGLIVQDTGKHNQGHSVEFPAYYFEQPLDHFSNNSETFAQRYWVSTRHYAPEAPGPVIVLDGGETSGEDRLPFLDTG